MGSNADYYLILVIILGILAIVDLMVGVVTMLLIS